MTTDAPPPRGVFRCVSKVDIVAEACAIAINVAAHGQFDDQAEGIFRAYLPH